MKRLVLIFSLFCLINTSYGQKIQGQWRGFFNSNGDIVLTGGDNTEYVLELDIDGSQVSGYSYTYFQNRRYYVICSLKGTFNNPDKTIRVTETARIKGLTPPGWTDCLQTHFLAYEKEGTNEKLVGKWRTAPGQLSDCGFGNTTLTRRTLSKSIAGYNKPQKTTPFSKPKTVNKTTPLTDQNKKNQPVAKNTTPVKPPVTNPPAVKIEPVAKNDQKDSIVLAKKETIKPIERDDINFEKRDNNVIRTIQIENESFKIDLYDNGDIDGDSISLFYNGKLLLSHKRLSAKPITLTLDATTENDINELTMYAENLGTIPPNTALMVVTDGSNRYEVRIASDLQKSGTIRFIGKKKTQ